MPETKGCGSLSEVALVLFIEIYVEGVADCLSMSGDIGDHRLRGI